MKELNNKGAVLIYAELLAPRGNNEAETEAERAAAAGAAFYMVIGNRPARVVELSRADRELRVTPRTRSLLAKALQRAAESSISRSLAAQERVFHDARIRRDLRRGQGCRDSDPLGA